MSRSKSPPSRARVQDGRRVCVRVWHGRMARAAEEKVGVPGSTGHSSLGVKLNTEHWLGFRDLQGMKDFVRLPAARCSAPKGL